MSRRAPSPEDYVDLPVDEDLGPPVAAPSQLARSRRDRFVVGIMTPALVVGVLLGLLIVGQVFYPDPYVPEPTPVPAARAGRGGGPEEQRAGVGAAVQAQPIDVSRLNAGVVEKPPAFEWPEIEDLKLVPNPGRPGEQADYIPALSSVDTRRLISAISVSVVLHTGPPLAKAAAEELAKSYPLRTRRQNVLDNSSATGYLPDESGFGVTYALNFYRVNVETIAASPPIRQTQRSDIEWNTLHVADHIARRVQEISTGGRRTSTEASAVHWRDHLVRRLPIGG